VSETIRLGRVAGLPLAAHWSVLFVVWLITWSLASGVLPEAVADQPTVSYWVAGAAGALTFFGSLLAHEVAHAIVARRSGLAVEGLTLWLFGGMAKLGGHPPNPQADLRIAAVGPATSLVLSASFGVLAVATAGLGTPELVVAVLVWLAAINLILGLFNLIPGAPLDGGRVLRALLWRRHGDWTRAALSAARAGQTVGYGLMGVGVLEFVLLPGIGGLWMVLIGWFVLNASRAERADVLTRQALGGVRVRDVMSRNPRIAPGWISVGELIERYLLELSHSAYPVEGLDGRILGLVTLHQLRAVPASERSTTFVADAAVPLDEVPTVSPDDPLESALQHLQATATGGRILVLDDHRLVGILTTTDVSHAVDVRRLGAPA
jgi:Zn-dependent protease/CBS domain-containing protein